MVNLTVYKMLNKTTWSSVQHVLKVKNSNSRKGGEERGKHSLACHHPQGFLSRGFWGRKVYLKLCTIERRYTLKNTEGGSRKDPKVGAPQKFLKGGT